MKKIKWLMMVTFAMAIGVAYATTSNSKLVFADSEQPVGSDCIAVTSGCNNSGSFNCGIVVYRLHAAGETPCQDRLLKKNTP